MLNVESGLSKNRAELLMEVVANAALLTQRAENLPLLARYLTATFNVSSVTIAIIKTVADGAVVLLSGTSATQLSSTFEQDLLDTHQVTRPLSTQEAPAVRSLEPGKPGDAVFTQNIDEQHRLLVITHNAGETQLSAEVTELLQLVLSQLARSLSTLILWITRPQNIGQPFDRLTDREWMVLRGLNSDAGEKQLADQLGLSPHTLHSHIKAIYRKVGVQGRLSLLQRVEEAMRDYRLGHASAQVNDLTAENGPRAVAFG